MKTESTGTGWKEIVTKKINITSIAKKPFMTVAEWLSSNHKLYGDKLPSKRGKCNYCKKKWSDISGDSYVYLVFTDKGNKIICAGCREKVLETI